VTVRVTIRRQPSTDHGTFGRLSVDGHAFTAYTGELPWRDNRKGASCIPAGIYHCIWALSPRFKRSTYRLVEVPGRSGVLIHPANLVGDRALGLQAQVQGCIVLGERLGWIGGQRAILRSMPSVRNFETLMGGKPFDLEIIDA